MKTRNSVHWTGMGMALLALLTLLFAGCASTPKVDWNARVGNYTYDQAVKDYGPPDKVAALSDGGKVCDWITGSSGGGTSVGFGFGSFGRHSATGVGVSQSVGSSHYNVMRLTFGPNNRLVTWSKN